MQIISSWKQSRSERLRKKLCPSCCFYYSVPQSCLTLCNPMDCSKSVFTISQSLPTLMSIELVMLSNYLILCHPPLLLPSIFPSISVFSNELALHISWPKYWSFSFSISPSNENSVSISFRMDLFDLTAVQGTLKSLLQHHSLKASIVWCSAFSTVQLLHLYKNTALSFYLTKKCT